MPKISKRREKAEAIQKIIKETPSADDQKILEQVYFYKGDEAKIWGYYIYDKAEEYGVNLNTAMAIFESLGPSEAFDGFLTELEEAQYAEQEE